AVGVDGLTLKQVDRPEVQIVGVNTIGVGLDVAAANVTIRGLAIYGFGINTSSATDADIRVRNSVTGTLIEDNVLGAGATGFTDPWAENAGVQLGFASGDVVSRNVISNNYGARVLVTGTGGNTITQNSIFGNGTRSTPGQSVSGEIGIDLLPSSQDWQLARVSP